MRRITEGDRAKMWHEARHREPLDSHCWCCCEKCSPDHAEDEGNPHYEEAMRLLRGRPC